MYKVLTTVIILTLLLGCTSKEEKALMQAYEKNKSYHKQLQKTEKTQLYDELVTKALLTATYLYEPSYQKEDKRDETFIVGIHIEESEIQTLNEGGFSLTLNEDLPKSIRKLKEDDKRLKNISFISEWSQLYLVTFPHTSSKDFKLIFHSDMYGKGELYFAKVAKYVLTKKAF